MLNEPGTIKDRWCKNWAQVFPGPMGTLDNLRAQAASQARRAGPRARLPPLDLEEVERLLAKLPANKAVGVDGISAKVWKAGGLSAALLAQAVLNASRACGRAPVLGKGGRTQDSWKANGGRGDPGNSRARPCPERARQGARGPAQTRLHRALPPRGRGHPSRLRAMPGA